MDLKTIASNLWPLWLLGIFIIATVFQSKHKDLLRIDATSVGKWIKFLLFITALRFVITELSRMMGAAPMDISAVSQIPWQTTLLVFWEDACHSLPLLILKRIIGDKKLLKPFYYSALVLISVSFGLGHIYQGVFSAILMSAYVPYTMKLGEKHGVGTVMVCHTLYDLFTIMFIKFMAG